MSHAEASKRPTTDRGSGTKRLLERPWSDREMPRTVLEPEGIARGVDWGLHSA